jgi:Caspase domain/Domain of unknown function (DUF4384)
MTKSLGVCCALSLVLWAASLRASFAQADGDQAGVKRALLVGINKYKAVPGLQGSVNDVETMREILISRWGFTTRNITVLTDESATHDRILSALTELVQVSRPEDTIYFHFSGHGSQVQDLNGDEDDGLDETLVPQDGRSGGVRDIVDDELDEIFSKLRTRKVLVVLDSCHSGTATRSFDIRARSVPQDMRVDLYRTGVTGTTKRGIAEVKMARLVSFGAAADNEEALDGPIDGSYHGFFTYAFARALSTAGANATPRQIFAAVSRELARIQTTFGRTSMPEPQLEGPAEAFDRPLFAGSASSATPSALVTGTAALAVPRVAWLDAEPSGGNQIMLLSGSLLGATPGSTWAIYPPGEKLFAAGRARAVATVTQVSGKDARATLAPDHNAIAPASRAVALLPAPSSSRIAIRILDVPSAERTRIEEVLKRHIKNVAWVGPDQPARYLIDMQGQNVRLLTADGLSVAGSFAISDENAAADVGRIASRSAKAVELLTLDNPSSQLTITARVVGSQAYASRDIQLVANTNPAQMHSRRQGEPRSAQNSLQLEIEVNANCFLTIVDVDSEGNLNVLFPNDYQHGDFYANGAVRAGTPALIPDSLQSANRAGFYWDYSPPRGTDTVRVFASTDLETARTIRQRIKTLQSAAAPKIRGGEDDFGPLRDDLGKLATRGIKVVADQAPGNSGSVTPSGPADWSATSLTIQVAD